MTVDDSVQGDAVLLAGLLAGKTVAEAAAAAGVSESTAYRRLRDGDFRRRLAEAREEVVSAAAARLADACMEAADTLRELLGASSEMVRLSAAKAVLELAAKFHENVCLADRVSELERAIQQQGVHRAPDGLRVLN